ncbi:hypothetical protein K440DRAFT_688565 [Wilcoxina mikolae CBS 423.85]|nr:hypothetical protein K440DRAFT_688565 [Wilcoxina mikolae CBS 423.85]
MRPINDNKFAPTTQTEEGGGAIALGCGDGSGPVTTKEMECPYLEGSGGWERIPIRGGQLKTSYMVDTEEMEAGRGCGHAIAPLRGNGVSEWASVVGDACLISLIPVAHPWVNVERLWLRPEKDNVMVPLQAGRRSGDIVEAQLFFLVVVVEERNFERSGLFLFCMGTPGKCHKKVTMSLKCRI